MRAAVRQHVGAAHVVHDERIVLEMRKRLEDLLDRCVDLNRLAHVDRSPARDTRETIAFVRKIKRLNPAAEIIVQHYIPTPHPDGMYGGIDAEIRPLVAPYVLQAALKRLSAELSIWRGKSLTTRRYMWKTEY